MDKNKLYDVIIIGGGPAGLTAALYLTRACYRVLVIEKERFGGQIATTAEVVNYPGIEITDGPTLTKKMKKQAKNFGAEFLMAEVTELKMDGDVKEVVANGETLYCLGVLLATGARPREVGFEGELEFKGHGVAYCATCDGEFFTDKQIFVIGGGYAAAEEAAFLTKYGKHVTVLIRKPDFSCAKSIADEAHNHKDITVLGNKNVLKVEGDTVLRSITYRDNVTGEITEYKADEGDTFGVFVFAGYIPETSLIKDIAELNEYGYVVTDKSQMTTKEGLFAAGDVCIKPLRQVVTAVGDAALAATELEKYVVKMQKKTGLVPTRPVRENDAPNRQMTPKLEKEEKKDESLFTEDMLAQMNMVFGKMEKKLILKLGLNNETPSSELRYYMEELAKLSDKIRLEIDENPPEAEVPYVKVHYDDGSYTGLAFHGVPGGHEFTSFMIGLYNASGPGQKTDADILDAIAKIDRKVNMRIIISLTCTNCPDLVMAAQRIAAFSPNVTAEVYDVNHFGYLREQYQIMSVPCLLIDDKPPIFGRKDIRQLLELIKA